MRTGVKQNRNLYKLAVLAVSRREEGWGGGRASRIPHPAKKKKKPPLITISRCWLKFQIQANPMYSPISKHRHIITHTHTSCILTGPILGSIGPRKPPPIPPPGFGGPLRYTSSIVNRCLYLSDNKSSGTCWGRETDTAAWDPKATRHRRLWYERIQ